MLVVARFRQTLNPLVCLSYTAHLTFACSAPARRPHTPPYQACQLQSKLLWHFRLYLYQTRHCANRGIEQCSQAAVCTYGLSEANSVKVSDKMRSRMSTLHCRAAMPRHCWAHHLRGIYRSTISPSSLIILPECGLRCLREIQTGKAAALAFCFEGRHRPHPEPITDFKYERTWPRIPQTAGRSFRQQHRHWCEKHVT